MAKVQRKIKYGKIITIGMGMIGIVPLALVLLVSFAYMSGIFDFRAPSVHQYEVTFTARGQIFSSQTYIKGERLGKVSRPSDYSAEGKNYTFIGWDYTGDNIIDILPERVYMSFTAKAIYSRTL